MGQAAKPLPAESQRQRPSKFNFLFVWVDRPQLLRELLQLARIRVDVAALFRRRWLGSFHGWSMGVLSRSRVWLGFCISLGMDALPFRQLGVYRGARLGVATGRPLDGPQYLASSEKCSSGFFGAETAGDSRAKSGRGQSGSDSNLCRALHQQADNSK